MSEDELTILDSVDTVPANPGARTSRWDAVIAQARDVADSDRPWLPVTRPKNFSGVKWLCRRDPNILVELRPERVYIKWDPAGAEAKRARDEALKSTKAERKND